MNNFMLTLNNGESPIIGIFLHFGGNSIYYKYPGDTLTGIHKQHK